MMSGMDIFVLISHIDVFYHMNGDSFYGLYDTWGLTEYIWNANFGFIDDSDSFIFSSRLPSCLEKVFMIEKKKVPSGIPPISWDLIFQSS